jgi:hypothetical protein
MSNLRETLLAKTNRTYFSVNVDGTEFWLQSLTIAESMEVTLAATNLKTGEYHPEKFVDLQAKQLVYSLVDGQGGDRLFADDEIGMLKSIDSKTFRALYKASESASGKGADEAETLGKSDSAPS